MIGDAMRPLWLAEDTGETEDGCGINQGQALALLVAPGPTPRLPLARLQEWPMRPELGEALARCSAHISFNVVWLRCASAQSTRVRLGALAGESSLFESFGLGIEDPESPRGRLDGG